MVSKRLKDQDGEGEDKTGLLEEGGKKGKKKTKASDELVSLYSIPTPSGSHLSGSGNPSQ